MKKIKISFLLAILLSSSVLVSAQCKDFTKDEVVPMLGDFILSGKYNALKMQEDEEILIYKTLTKEITYRFVVKAEATMPQNIIVKITDWNDNEIKSNEDDPEKNIFDIKSEKTQRVKIFVKVPLENKDDPKIGCVSLVIGLKNE